MIENYNIPSRAKVKMQQKIDDNHDRKLREMKQLITSQNGLYT